MTSNKITQKELDKKDSTPVVSLYIERKDWFKLAGCKGKTELMFPKQHKDITYIAQARAICKSCPVRRECLKYALEFPSAASATWKSDIRSQLPLDSSRQNGPHAADLAGTGRSSQYRSGN